jgi:hypothetical protein
MIVVNGGGNEHVHTLPGMWQIPTLISRNTGACSTTFLRVIGRLPALYHVAVYRPPLRRVIALRYGVNVGFIIGCVYCFPVEFAYAFGRNRFANLFGSRFGFGFNYDFA